MGNVYIRQRLKIRQADANSASGDTGQPFFGELMQMRWVPTVGDSGAGLIISLVDVPRPPTPIALGGGVVPNDTGGPGTGWLFYNKEDALGATAYTRAPRQPISDLDGFDTGAATVHQAAPVVSAGQSLRVKSVPAGNGIVSGDLLFWIKS